MQVVKPNLSVSPPKCEKNGSPLVMAPLDESVCEKHVPHLPHLPRIRTKEKNTRNPKRIGHSAHKGQS